MWKFIHFCSSVLHHLWAFHIKLTASLCVMTLCICRWNYNWTPLLLLWNCRISNLKSLGSWLNQLSSNAKIHKGAIDFSRKTLIKQDSNGEIIWIKPVSINPILRCWEEDWHTCCGTNGLMKVAAICKSTKTRWLVSNAPTPNWGCD